MIAEGMKQPGIRIRHGSTRHDRTDERGACNHEPGIGPLMAKALGVHPLREDREEESEFMTISYWESVEAMAAFPGADPRQILRLPRTYGRTGAAA